MNWYSTAEEAQEAVLERIKGRFAEQPDLMATYLALEDEDREKAKSVIYKEASKGVKVDTGRTRTLKGRMTEGMKVPIRRPLETPSIERNWKTFLSGDLGIEDLSAEQAGNFARIAAKEEPQLEGLFKTDPAYVREYMKAQMNYRKWVETDMWPEDERAKGFWDNAAQTFVKAVASPNFAITQWRQRAKRVPFGNPENLGMGEIRKRAQEAAIADMMPQVMGWDTFEGGEGRTFKEKAGRFTGDALSFFLPTGKRFLFEAGMKGMGRATGKMALTGWKKRLLKYGGGGATLGAGEAIMEPLPASEADTAAGLAGRILERGATGAVTGAALGEVAYRALGGLGYAWAQTLGRDTPLMKTIQKEGAEAFAERFFKMAERVRTGNASTREKALIQSFNAWAQKQGVDTKALARGEVGFEYRKLVPREWTEKFPIIRGVLPDVAERVRPRSTQAPNQRLMGEPLGAPIPKMPPRGPVTGEPLALPGEVSVAQSSAGASFAGRGDAPIPATRDRVEPIPSPVTTSEVTASTESAALGGDKIIAGITAEAQALSKNQLRKEGVKLRKEIKTLAKRIEQGGGGADVGELQAQWNGLQAKEAIYADELKKRPAGRAFPRMAKTDIEGEEDILTDVLEFTQNSRIPVEDASLLTGISPELRKFFKKGTYLDTLYEDFPDRTTSEEMAVVAGNPDGQVQILIDRMEDALAARKAKKELLKQYEYEARTDAAIFDNVGRVAKHRSKAAVDAENDLKVGDQFTVRGEAFEVKDIDPETGELTLKDGKIVKVPPNTFIYVDRGQVEMEPYNPKGGETVQDYIYRAFAQQKGFDKALLEKEGGFIPAAFKVRGDLVEPETSLAQYSTLGWKRKAAATRFAERKFAEAEALKMPDPKSGKLLEEDSYKLLPESAEDSAAALAAERARRAQDAAQRQMFDPSEVRGIEGEIDTPRGGIDTPFSAGPYAQGGEVNTALENARAGRPVGETDFQRLALNLNEMVSLANDLGKGKYPKIMESIMSGKARGVFRGDVLDPRIELQKDIFELLRPDEIQEIQKNILKGMMAESEAALTSVALESEAVKEFSADELEAFKKVVQEKPELLNKFKELEREQLDAARREVAPTREPEQALMTLAHEIGHWIDFVPDSSLSRGNVLGRIASLHKYYKKMLPKEPNEDFEGQMITQNERAKMRAQALKDAGEDKELAKQIYAEKLEIERKARGLITLAEVRGELVALTTWWRLGGNTSLFDPKYHGKPEELYADAFSVLLNAPAELAKRAPNFYDAFESYFGRKKAAGDSYEAMQKAIKEGNSEKEQVRKLREALEKPSAQLTERGAAIRFSELWDGLTSMVLREFQPLYRRAKRGGRESFKRTQEVVSNYLYRATSHELYLMRLNNEIMGPLHNANVNMADFDEYLFHKHVIHNRFNIANPLGWTAKTSTARLQEIEASNSVQYAALEAAQLAWWKIRQRMVIEPLKESGVFNEELIKTIGERVFYTPFRKLQEPMQGDGLELLLKQHFGRDMGMRIAKQMGTLKEVRSPSNSLMATDLRLMDFAKRNAAKQEVVRIMQSYDAQKYQTADTRKVQRRGRWVKEPIHVDTPQIGTLYTMQKGEITGHYLPKALTVPFTSRQNINAEWYTRALYHSNTWQKSVFTQLNPGFWPMALLRDVFTRYRKMPTAKRQLYRNFAPVGIVMDTAAILRRFPAAWRSVRGTADPLVQNAMERGLLISRRETMGYGNTFKGADIDRALMEFDKDPRNYYQKRSETELKISKAMSFWLSIGQAFERSPKLATMRYLDENFPNWPEWKKRNFIRQHGGSPDFLQRGTIAQALDLVAFFWNPAREGWMSEPDAFVEDKAGYTARAIQMLLPSMAFKLAGLGLLGVAPMSLILMLMPWIRDEEEMQKMFQSISHYDMTNYDVIPLFWVDKELKKLMYVRIPKDETSRLILGSLMQPALQGGGLQNINANIWTQVPGLNPTLGVLQDWFDFALNGQNPYDSFIQRPVIDPTEFKAGKGLETMWWHTWNSLGGGIIKRVQPEPPDFKKDAQLEKFLNLPVVQNTMGRWFKVSNAGARQRVMKAPEVKAAGRKAAQETLHAREIVDRITSGKTLTKDQMLLLQYGTTVREKVNRYLNAAALRGLGPEAQAIESLPTKQEKEAAIQFLND